MYTNFKLLQLTLLQIVILHVDGTLNNSPHPLLAKPGGTSPGMSSPKTAVSLGNEVVSSDSELSNQGLPPSSTPEKKTILKKPKLMHNINQLTRSTSNPDLSTSGKPPMAPRRSNSVDFGSKPREKKVTFSGQKEVLSFSRESEFTSLSLEPAERRKNENGKDKMENTEVELNYSEKFLPNINTVFGNLPLRVFKAIGKYIENRFWEKNQEFWNEIARFVSPTLAEGEKMPFTKEQLGYLFYIIWVFGKESWSFPWKH